MGARLLLLKLFLLPLLVMGDVPGLWLPFLLLVLAGMMGVFQGSCCNSFIFIISANFYKLNLFSTSKFMMIVVPSFQAA